MKKTTKKLTALVLALMMALSCMAMPAMAANEDEGIMPHKPVVECDVCYGSAEYIGLTRVYDYSSAHRVDACSSIYVAHVHINYDAYELYECTHCGHQITGNYAYSDTECRRDI